MSNQISDEKNLLLSFEQGVRDLACIFQGKKAFNFSHELELVMYLLMQMRNADKYSVDRDGIPIYLTRIEWPCIPGRNIDMVIWRPGSEKQARQRWGTQRGKLAKMIPLLAAIQVRRGGGNVVGTDLTIKDIKDLENVYKPKALGNPKLYFIEYADEDLKEDTGDYKTYLSVKNYLKKMVS